jgi:tripartite-type tricarboxylate transporter receptor subunit TctC
MRPARLLCTAIAALALTATAAWAQSPAGGTAQSYPNQLVRIIVPVSAGSQTDILARAYAEKLQARWKQDVIVENRPGLAGTPKEILEKISRDVVAVTAAPDLNQKFTEFGVELAPTTPDEFYAIVKADTDKFTKIFARKN